jgi:hypothetical protein
MAAESFVNNGPLPKNDEKLFRPTSVKVLRAFCVKGVSQEVGSIITIPYHLAVDMQSIKKCVISI